MAEFCIGITGNIGSGKSTVAKILSENGFSVISADLISKKLLSEQKHINWVLNTFGDHLISENGLNRTELGKVIFNDPGKKLILEEYLHPLINSEFKLQLQQLNNPVCYDIPLLFEAMRPFPEINYKVVVYCPKETSIQRVMIRNSCSRKEAELRYSNQMPIEEKVKLADYVIDNSGSLEALEQNTLAFIKEYLKNCTYP